MDTRARYHLPVILIACALPACTHYHVRKADEAYSLMAYAKAERLYTSVLKHHVDRDILLRAATSCQRQNELVKAEHWFHMADSIGTLNGEDAFHYGQVLMGLGNTKAAAARFFQVVQERPEDAAAMDLYASCEGYRSFFEDSGRFVVNALTLPGIKTAFSAFPYKRGLLVAGETDAPRAKADPWNGLSFLDLYYCEKKTIVTWLPAQPVPGAVNGPYHEGPAVVTPDGRTMYFTRSNYMDRKLGKDASNTSHLKLFRAQLDSTGKWSDIRSFAYNTEDLSIGHPALSPDGKELFFASDRPGGFGGSDIWRSRDNGTGWSEPENLGPTVNTPGNELFPTVSGDVLYFSSTAHNNMGGLDIFETHQENGKWSEPKNMNAPINTSHDDFAFILEEGGRTGYLSSDRDGSDRVYTFTMYEPTFSVDGIVSDSTMFLPNTAVTLTELATMKDTSVITGSDGKFNFPLKANSDYRIKAERSDLITSSRAISTKGLTRNDVIHVAFGMEHVVFDKPFALNSIYYDYDKWDLRPEATAELDKLAILCKENPDLNFELSSHTDSRGGDTYNLVLSDARANSAVNYLIQHGVNPDRIVAHGYGESVLVNKCHNGVKCSEEEHQMNRRTEFRITGIREITSER